MTLVIDDLHPAEALDKFVARLKPEIALELKKVGCALFIEQAFDIATSVGAIVEQLGGYGNSKNERKKYSEKTPLNNKFETQNKKISYIPQNKQNNINKYYGAPMEIDQMINSLYQNKNKNQINKESPTVKLGKLTEKERNILKENNGCFRCRKIFAGHQTHNCPEFTTTINNIENNKHIPEAETDFFYEEEDTEPERYASFH